MDSWIPSYDDFAKESTALFHQMTKVEDTPTKVVDKVDAVQKKKETSSLYETATTMVHDATSRVEEVASSMGDVSNVGSLLAETASDLTTINVKAGGKVTAEAKVDVDGTINTNNTVTFALDRYSILYSALASFIAMEAYHYFTK